MYGWRGRIGMIMPDNNTVLEPEMYSVLPDGLSLHCGRVVMRGGPARERVPSGVAALPSVIEGLHKRVGVLTYACMTSSIFQEVGWHRKLEESLHGVPFLPAGETMVRALREFEAARIGIFSPWHEEIAAKAAPWFANFDMEVAYHASVPFTRDEVTGHDVAEFFQRILREFRGKNLDALCIVGTDWGSLDVIDPLEQDLGIPVITSNLALLWCAMGAIGVNENIGIGTLFDRPTPSDDYWS